MVQRGIIMNKLMGFYELKDSGLPTIPWQIYTGKEDLDSNLLWTIRTAVFKGEDLSLPRAIGVTADEAHNKAQLFINQLKDNGIVIFYPYFVANKSGTLNIYNDKYVIEAVKDDLWNLVTESKRDVTIIGANNGDITFNGNKDFLSIAEQKLLASYAPYIRKLYRDELLQGNNLLLEWSFAVNTDVTKSKIGDEYLVFYEIRTT